MDAEEKKLHIKLAYGYYQNKEYRKAIGLYEKIYKDDTEDFNVLNMLSDTYFKADLKDKALEAYADTLMLLEKKGHYEKILRLAKKILKNFPDDQRIKTRLKNSLRSLMKEAERKAANHEYADARAIYESIQEFNSDEHPVNIKIKELNDDESAFVNRTRKQEEMKKSSEPQDTQKDLINKFDKMAQNYMNNGDFDGAVETYITALKLAPGNEELRAKLHAVYVRIAGGNAGEKVWNKVDKNPAGKLEEAKRKALEERQAQIMKEEEDRARLMLDEDEKIQKEYEEKEMAIIQAAAVELKAKLDEAQKNEKLKEDEVQRIMKEQEEKKRELLEKLKREAIDKFKKQKDSIVEQTKLAMQQKQQLSQPKPAEPEPASDFFDRKPASTANLMDTLKKAYETPKVGPSEENGREAMEKMFDDTSKEIKSVQAAQAAAQTHKAAGPQEIKREAPPVFPDLSAAKAQPAPKAEYLPEPKTEEILDDIGEAERPVERHQEKEEKILVNEDTLDSLITMSFIYINQGAYKDAMKIYNALAEKYPNNGEVKNIATEISKRQG